MRYERKYDYEKIVGMYHAGMMNREISAEMGCDPGVIRTALRAAGIRRPSGPPSRRVPAFERVMRSARLEGECLVYTGYRNAAGYGWVSGDRSSKLAHRVVWAHHYGEPPPRLVVMHACDNPPCVEISHLRLGTYAENSADMVAKGRSNHERKHHKYTDEQIRDLRAAVADGCRVDWAAEELGINVGYARNVVAGSRR